MSNDYNGKKRSELPDSVFGIPQERKYPMPDEKHTRSAIKLFNHVDPKYEEQLAKAIIKNMKKYNIDSSMIGPNNRLRKYLPKDMIKEIFIRSLEKLYMTDYSSISESYNKSDFSYNNIKSSKDKSEFKRNFKDTFKEYPTESSISSMKIIKYKGIIVGYIGFSTYTVDRKKYLGIGNFMIIKKYQHSGIGSKVISDIIDKYKDNYDEIYCYVDKNNTGAIAFYNKIATINTDNLTKYGYYVTLYSKSIGESSMLPKSTKISTVIFDIGDVLVSTNMRDYLIADPEIPNEIVDKLLKLWFIDKDDIIDILDLATYREIVNKRMGIEFSKYIPKLFKYNVDCVNAFDYTIPTIQYLKNKGYKVYYLSNWSAWTYDLLNEAGKFDFLKLMDGGVFSYDVGYMKPHEEIYKILLNKYKINPEEAVFFDDMIENIEAANKLGIHGVHFPRHDPDIVYNALEKFSVLYEQAIQSINEVSKNRRYYNYNVLEDAYLSYMNEISLWVKVDEDKVAKEILNIIRPIIISQDNKSKASKMGLSLKCEIEEVDSGIVFILVLDGTQDKRDTDDARIMLKELASKCKPKLSNLVSKIDIGDGEEGCLYFTMDKGKIKKNRKDLIKESTNEEIAKSEINDIKEIISILNDDDFKNFKFTNIAYCDIRYRNSKPIAFITIRTKPVNNYIVGFVSLAVIPKYQNQGIGRSLTEKAIKWFKKNKGIYFLEWHCLPNNAASNKLANDAGFSKYIAKDDSEYNTYTMESVIETNISEYGTTGGTIVGANQPDSVYIVNYMQNNVFSGYKEPKQAICKKGMNQMYTTKNGKAVHVDKDKFKEEASDISVFRFKETPVLSFDKIIENASVDEDFFLLLTGDFPEDRVGKLIEYDNRFVQEENFFDELDDITCCTESTIIGQIDTSKYPYMKVLTESMEGRCWNYYRDINGVFAMNELTGLRTPSYEDVMDIPKSQIKLIERGTVYLGE